VRDTSSETLRAFEAFAHAQGAMYRGGDRGAVRQRLAPDVIWHVPGENAIAGDHRGRDAVMAYFARRRALAGGSMAILAGERLVSGDVVVQFADGELERDGERLSWRTVGVYRFEGEQVAEAWLIPLESASFDAIWAALGRA
jgi:ketosteroid isomerase-like protein